MIHEVSAYVVSERLRQVQSMLVKYSPNQPRVPAGSSAGGQWTSGGGSASAEKLQKIVVKRDGIPVEQTNIFVGGADDEGGLFGNHPVQGSGSLKEDVYGDNYYATHDEIESIDALIRNTPEGRLITITGHSLGGNTAAQAVVRNPGRVSILVTIDPVGGDEVDYSKIQSSVGNWINVNAAGKPDRVFSDRFRLDNLAAGVGGPWNVSPQDYADIYISAPYNHADFNAMIRYQGANGRSAQDMLNGK
jgi:pimeloyl-ACP methyl ester carboxylesterase